MREPAINKDGTTRKRKRYPLAFKLKILRSLKRKTATELAEKYGIAREMIYHWRIHREELLEQKAVGGKALGYYTRLALVRRKLRRITSERDILKKAVSYFDKQSRRSASSY